MEVQPLGAGHDEVCLPERPLEAELLPQPGQRVDDAATQRLLNRGARLTELLKQAQFSPMPVEEQTVSIFAGTNGSLDAVPVERVTDYESQMLAFMRSEHADVLTLIRDSREFGDEARGKTKAALDAFAKQFA